MSPSASLCVRAHDDEKPSAAGGEARRRAAAPSRASSSGVAVAAGSRRSPMTTRRIVEWPTRKPAFGASVPSMRSRYSPNVVQSHGTPARERVERHALDAGEHAHQVVAVLGRERRDREAAVPADHRRHAVQRRRASASCPRTPARRSACGCRRSRARRPCRRRRSSASASSTSPIATMRPSRMPTSARRARPPRAVDDLATSDHAVEHARTLPPARSQSYWGLVTAETRRTACA